MKVALLEPYSVNNCGLHSYTSNVSKGLKAEGIDVIDINLGYLGFLKAQKYIPNDVDLIHNVSSYYYTHGKLPKPSVMTVYDTIPWDHPEWMSLKSNLYHRAFGMRSIRKYDKLIAISCNTARDLRQHKIKQPIEIIHPGINEIFFDEYKDDLEDHLWNDLKFDLYVGGFDPRKNVDLLINWWSDSKYARGEFLILAGGNGWNNKNTYKLIEQTDGVLCIRSPSIETLFRLYHNCLDFYYPSLYEGYGLPLAEAMACKCNVHHFGNSSLNEVKPLHWKDQIKKIIRVYDSLLE